MRCIWCNVPLSYYGSEEHASRQNCLVADSGYHTFAHCPCFARMFVRRNSTRRRLLARRQERRANTI